jgi:hypothetical protein
MPGQYKLYHAGIDRLAGFALILSGLFAGNYWCDVAVVADNA